jgi:hypothetical protein
MLKSTTFFENTLNESRVENKPKSMLNDRLPRILLGGEAARERSSTRGRGSETGAKKEAVSQKRA